MTYSQELTCCEDGRLFDLWVVLGDFDQRRKDAEVAREVAASKRVVTQMKGSQARGVGYESGISLPALFSFKGKKKEEEEDQARKQEDLEMKAVIE